MTLHREQSVKREKNQQDAVIKCLLLTSISTCFGQHYACLQENKEPVVVGRCSRQRPTTGTNHIQQNQNNTPDAVTGSLFS